MERIIGFKRFKQHCNKREYGICQTLFNGNNKCQWDEKKSKCAEANCPVFKRLKKVEVCHVRISDTDQRLPGGAQCDDKIKGAEPFGIWIDEAASISKILFNKRNQKG